MNKEDRLYFDISVDIEIDKEIDKYFADRESREEEVIKNQNAIEAFKKLLNRGDKND